MNFIADKQTLEDLNILGKYKPSSIYNLFNKVHTTGGEKLLEQMFYHPFSDPNEINKRVHIFKYFQKLAVDFPWYGDQLTAMENYLTTGSENNLLLTAFSVIKKKVFKSILHDEQYRVLLSGLQETINVLVSFMFFLSKLNPEDPNNPFKENILALKLILNSEQLKPVLLDRWSAKPPLFKVIRYHHFLNVTLSAELKKIIESIYFFDLHIAVGKVATLKQFGYANALPDSDMAFSADDLRHPGIDNAIGNSLKLTSNSNLIFLTGANMAGKSTFMKALGINMYLAHMGFPVAANNMVFSVKQGIYSSINVPDNLDKGYSHFYAEVLRVKKVAREVNSGKNLLVIFDELFKGTNVKDAHDATLAITAAFSEYENCSFVMSTHIIEAGEAMQQQYSNMQFLYMPTQMNGNTPTYTYKIRHGISNDRHGMMIIENEKIIETILSKINK